MYYQKSEYPTFPPLGLFMPGGNRKTNNPIGKLPPSVLKNGITYPLVDSKGKRIIYPKGSPRYLGKKYSKMMNRSEIIIK
jgi:hypothetical protein